MNHVIGITMGDPLGIGPEIILQALPKLRSRAKFLVFGDGFLLHSLPAKELAAVTENKDHPLSPLEAGRAAIAYLDRAMEFYREGKIQALVTAPISKSHVHLAGFPFPGHTEYLAAKTGVKKYLMMMAGPRLKVSLVTIHLPLAEVPKKLGEELIIDAITLTSDSLKRFFQRPQPRVAVCGLNPHAGEGGLLGKEEIDIITPAIAEAARRGYEAQGPVVPDAVFHEAYEGKWDAVICMYHDQALIPFKMIHFYEGVNVTLGLPLIRTSPDHGTAFDIAGKGIASSKSMEAAMEMAIAMLERSKV